MSELFGDWLVEQGMEREMDVLTIDRRQFHAKPQTGTRRRMTWSELGAELSVPAIGESKDAAGGLSPALYRDNIRRKANLIAVWLLVVDIDVAGDVDRIADALAAYDAIVHETYSSTPGAPRCRAFLRCDGPIDASTYEATHRIVCDDLRAAIGCGPDTGAKDASRLSYWPVRRPGSGYRFRVTSGRALSPARVIASVAREEPNARPVAIAPQHADAYRRGALRRAAQALADAATGARHETLNAQAYSLARLGLSHDEIRDALLPTAVSAMGEARRREAERTIADAVRARRGAA